MSLNWGYFAVVINSTFRMMTPVLFVALGAALCNRVKIFNIALEGTMLTGAFFAVVVNYYTGNIMLSILGACISSMLVALVAGVLMVKLDAAPLVVGVSINSLMAGATTFLMSYIFGVKGAFTSSKLVSLPKVKVPFATQAPILNTMFGMLTHLDFFAVIIAVLIYIFLFKTPLGFRTRAVGINKAATESLGTRAELYQILVVVFSGVLAGFGGCLLTLGQVTMFAEEITAGRGFFALAASNLGGAHPLGIILSSLFFGFAEAIGNMLQGTSIKSQLTMALPYVATIVVLVIFNLKDKDSKENISLLD